LVDWYLSKHLLHLTIPQNAGLAQKLQTLDAEARLGIGRFLFQTTIFEPRNNAIHRYELVDLAQARNAYELANLTIRNCRNTEPAHLSPVFYGRLELYRGEEALRKAESQMKLRDADTAFHFAGIGNSGEYAVFIDRNDRDSRISILTSLGNGAAEARLF
jgi:Predicted phosphoglycerate mutase, AP superfamily